MNVRILVVDDHPTLRAGLRHILSQRPGFVLVAEAETGAAALRLIEQSHTDLVLMDLHLPDLSGIELTRRMLAARPQLKVVVFSSDAERASVSEALQAGACGYVLKLSPETELLQAIEMVMSGKLYFSPGASAAILEDYRTRVFAASEPIRPTLADRDHELLRMIAEGRRSKEIAAEWGVTPKAVEAYRARLMKKVGCLSVAELVRFAIRQGIVPA